MDNYVRKTPARRYACAVCGVMGRDRKTVWNYAGTLARAKRAGVVLVSPSSEYGHPGCVADFRQLEPVRTSGDVDRAARAGVA